MVAYVACVWVLEGSERLCKLCMLVYVKGLCFRSLPRPGHFTFQPWFGQRYILKPLCLLSLILLLIISARYGSLVCFGIYLPAVNWSLILEEDTPGYAGSEFGWFQEDFCKKNRKWMYISTFQEQCVIMLNSNCQ